MEDILTSRMNESNITVEVVMTNISNILMPFNITNQVPLRYAIPLFGYVMPFLLLVTIVANTLIVVVLSQSHMRTPTNIVLLTMAISDTLTLMFPAPWYFYMYTLGFHAQPLGPAAACYAYQYMIEIMPSFFHTASIWLTLLLATQRYIYVCHITTARTWCTIPHVLRAISIIFVVSLFHQTTRFVDRTFVTIHTMWGGKLFVGCSLLGSAHWVRTVVTEMAYFTFFYMFRIIFVHVGPCVILVVLNALLFRALKRAQRNKEKLFGEKAAAKKQQREGNSTTWMLIVVVSVFLVVEIPLAVTTLLHVMQNALDINIADYNALNTTIIFINFLLVLSYPVNFAIYCGMSRQFRGTFKTLFFSGNRFPSCRRGSSDKTRYSLVNGPSTQRTSTNETVL